MLLSFHARSSLGVTIEAQVGRARFITLPSWILSSRVALSGYGELVTPRCFAVKCFVVLKSHQAAAHVSFDTFRLLALCESELSSEEFFSCPWQSLGIHGNSLFRIAVF